MFARLKAAAWKMGSWTIMAIRAWPYWGVMLLIASMLYKLNWLDDQFNVGGMNHWKWFVNLGAMMLATGWTIFLGRRSRAVALALLDAGLSFVVFADLIYFRYFKDFISVPVLLQAGQVGELEDSIWSLIHTGDMILFADVPIAFGLAIWALWRSRARRKTRLADQSARHADKAVRRRYRRAIMLNVVPGILVLAIGWSLIYYPVEEQKNGWARGLFVGNWWNVPIYNVTGLFGFHGYDTYRYAKENWFGKGLTEEQKNEVRTWYSDRRELQKQMETEPLFGAYKGKNVLVVQAEAFQEFVIGQSIGGEEITPNLNKLIGQSVYFPNFYHQTAQGRTSDADFAANCSMHPMPTGSVFIRFAGNSFDCAPGILKSEGYDTTVHHAYDGSFWNRYNMYNNLEYDHFYDLKDYKNDEPLGWSIGDKSFFRQTVEQLKTRGESPFYALAITISSHHPYKLPYNKQELNVGSFSGTIFGDYLQAAHYVDSAIGELIDQLKKENLWDNTIMMFYGDHDNSIYDWKPYEQFLDRPITELDKDAILRKVPFFIHLPEDAQAGVREKAVGQMDVTPTIMHLLGIPMGQNYLMGVSMLSDAPKSVVFRTGGYTDGSHYFVPSSDGIVANGACYALPGGEKAADASACAAGADAAKLDLKISDWVIENDLIAKFRKENAQ